MDVNYGRFMNVCSNERVIRSKRLRKKPILQDRLLFLLYSRNEVD